MSYHNEAKCECQHCIRSLELHVMLGWLDVIQSDLITPTCHTDVVELTKQEFGDGPNGLIGLL